MTRTVTGALVAIVALASAPSIASAQDTTATYEGTATVVEVDNPPDLPPSMAREVGVERVVRTEVACDATSCLVTALGPRVTLEGANGAYSGTETITSSSDSCPTPPTIVEYEANFAGDQLEIVMRFPATVFDDGSCFLLGAGYTERFTLRLVDGDPPVGVADDPTPTDEAPTSEASSGDTAGDSGGAPVAAVGAAAIVVAAGGAAAVVVRRRARPSSRRAGSPGPGAPQVRPVHDPGRQSVTPGGPSTSVGVVAVHDMKPSITVVLTGDGSTDRSE